MQPIRTLTAIAAMALSGMATERAAAFDVGKLAPPAGIVLQVQGSSSQPGGSSGGGNPGAASPGPRGGGGPGASSGGNRGGGEARSNRGKKGRSHHRGGGGGGVGIYIGPSYGYEDASCESLRRRAVRTGSPYWWRRYRQCVS